MNSGVLVRKELQRLGMLDRLGIPQTIADDRVIRDIAIALKDGRVRIKRIGAHKVGKGRRLLVQCRRRMGDESSPEFTQRVRFHGESRDDSKVVGTALQGQKEIGV